MMTEDSDNTPITTNSSVVGGIPGGGGGGGGGHHSHQRKHISRSRSSTSIHNDRHSQLGLAGVDDAISSNRSRAPEHSTTDLSQSTNPMVRNRVGVPKWGSSKKHEVMSVKSGMDDTLSRRTEKSSTVRGRSHQRYDTDRNTYDHQSTAGRTASSAAKSTRRSRSRSRK